MNQENTQIEQHILDVGQGSSCVIFLPRDEQYPNGGMVVIDAGPKRGKHDSVLLKVLDQYRQQPIVAFVISHTDSDHIGGALSILEGHSDQIQRVYLPVDRENPLSQPFFHELKRQRSMGRFKGKIFESKCNDNEPKAIIKTDSCVLAIILPHFEQSLEATELTESQRRNQSCAVLSLQCEESRCLIPGDSNRMVMSQLNPDKSIRWNIVIAPHQVALAACFLSPVP